MTAAPEIRAAVGKNIQHERERTMYGCTEAELRESVESSITFRFTGPAMVAASMLSDCQEIMAHIQCTYLCTVSSVAEDYD